jgi:signal peptidase I
VTKTIIEKTIIEKSPAAGTTTTTSSHSEAQIRVFSTPGVSMVPTIKVGQKFDVNLNTRTPALVAVVVFHPPEGATKDVAVCGSRSEGFDKAQPCDVPTPQESSQTSVKRVVGLPGDTLRIVKGHVYRNGMEEAGAYVQPCTEGNGQCTFADSITIPAGDYYVMGDNRGLSDDSRFWGPVPQQEIIGDRRQVVLRELKARGVADILILARSSGGP